MDSLLRFAGATRRDPAVERWLNGHLPALNVVGRWWFEKMRACGGDVTELMHDGCANACIEDVPFAYVGIFKAHVNVGFFRGAQLPDPQNLLLGTGNLMRHVKVTPGTTPNNQALTLLIDAAYADIKARLRRTP